MGNTDAANTIEGRLTAITGKEMVAGAAVWLAATTVDGAAFSERTTADHDGCFSFAIPTAALASAMVGADIEGAQPVDLEPNGAVLEPGDLVVMIDDIVPGFLRNAG